MTILSVEALDLTRLAVSLDATEMELLDGWAILVVVRDVIKKYGRSYTPCSVDWSHIEDDHYRLNVVLQCNNTDTSVRDFIVQSPYQLTPNGSGRYPVVTS